MNIPILNRLLDERFFDHRRRSTSTAGIIAAQLSLVLFLYHYFVGHVVSWDLLVVGAVFVAVKLALMTWYYLTD